MRKLSSFKNFITSTVPFIILIFIGFWKVNIWQNTLDQDIYALNQLFFQIFAYLSLAEAGVGALVQKEYYKLFITDDREKICIFYTLSRKMLRVACYIIIVVGSIVSFFIPMMAKGNNLTSAYMQKIFMLFLGKSLVDYFMFSPRFVLQADQKLYKINIQMNAYKILEGIMEVIFIMKGMKYEHVLILVFFLRILMNYHINKLVFKEYPWLKTVKDTKELKITGMRSVFIYKVVSVIYENVDILLVSSFVNPLSVIIYSNYKYITKYLTDLLYLIGNSITASLGNLLYTVRDENTYHTYEMISTMFYFIAAFLTVVLGFCMNSFISIWVGADKLFDPVSFVCVLFLFFHGIVRRPQYILKDIFALYKELQMISIIESVLNLILSFLFVHSYGIRGVLVATVISTLSTNFWYFPTYLYRKIFDKRPWLDFIKYLSVEGMVVLIIAISYKFIPHISTGGYIIWFVQSCIYSLSALIVLLVLFSVMFKSFRRLLVQATEMLLSIIKHDKNSL